MYVIGNIILGTHLPWDDEKYNAIVRAMVAADPDKYRTEIELADGTKRKETDDELLAAADAGEVDDVIDSPVWEVMYHGAAPGLVAYCGVKLGELDETDHFSFDSLMARGAYTVEQRAEALEKYNQIPELVRAMLPPFGVYVVWSSS